MNRMSNFFWSLRFRLILLVLLAIIPSTGLMLYTAAQERQHLAGEARQRTLYSAQATSAQWDLLAESTRQLLAGLARLPAVRQRDAEACSALLAGMLQENPSYANLLVTDSNGDLWCSVVPAAGPVNYADRDWFSEAVRTRRFAIGGYVMGRITRRPLATFAYPLLDDAGQVQGVLVAALDLAWLSRFLAGVPLPQEAVLIVVDSNGVVLARTLDAEKWVGQTLPEAEIVRIVLQQRGAGTAEAVGVDGVRRLYAYAPLQGPAGPIGHVIVGIPTAQVYAEADRALWRNLAGLGIVTLLALAAAWIGSEVFFMRRINALMAAVQRMAEGALAARTGVGRGRGELSRLARAFDEMAASLQQGQIERERQLQTIQHQRDTLATHSHIIQAILQTFDLDERLNRILDEVTALLNVELLRPRKARMDRSSVAEAVWRSARRAWRGAITSG